MKYLNVVKSGNPGRTWAKSRSDAKNHATEQQDDGMWLDDVIAVLGPPWYDDVTKQPLDEAQVLAGV